MLRSSSTTPMLCRPAEVSVTKSSVIMCAAAAAGGVGGWVRLCTRAAVHVRRCAMRRSRVEVWGAPGGWAFSGAGLAHRSR